MEKPRLALVIPVLPSKDISAATAFYVDRLGFTLRFVDDALAPRYAGVRRDNSVIHLQWHDPDEWSAVERPMLRIFVDNVAALFEEYRGQGVFHDKTALRKTGWRTEEFAFYDQDGNGLTFARDLAEGE
jgi:catechol 2,3-dioxygenase-like lactoylglutathione lyase family enzyme